MTTLLDLSDERFVSLTTFRKSGEGVSTPVWIARDGDDLYVTTPAGSGKVKRLRNGTRVELRPCSRMGKVEVDAPVVTAAGHIDESDTTEDRVNEIMLEKYGMEYRIMMGIEKIGGKKSAGRVILRISAV